MKAVDPPHESADATNSNAASEQTLTAAGYPIGGWLVKADVTRSGTLDGFQIADLRAFFQERFSGCRVRSQWGSEMDDRIRQYLGDCEEAAARHARDTFGMHFAIWDEGSESQIESLMLAAFLRLATVNNSGYPEEIEVIGNRKHDPFGEIQLYAWRDLLHWHQNGYLCGRTYIIPQVTFGQYRVDFLLGALEINMLKDPAERLEHWVAVECDGHDFHDRTKEQAQRDKARDRFLVSSGVKVLRFTGAEIWRDPTACAFEALKVVDPSLTVARGHGL